MTVSRATRDDEDGSGTGGGGSHCICLRLLEEKRDREYENLRGELRLRAKGSSSFKRTLIQILKTGNKLRAIKEVIAEIREVTEVAIPAMIPVEIAGRTTYRLSEDTDRRRSCAGKIAYQSEEEAKEAVIRMVEMTDKPFDDYRCRHCNARHIGHSATA